MRLIDADKIEWVQVKADVKAEGKEFGEKTYALILVEHLNEIPSVDAVPVKHGRWIDMDDHVLCSLCGATHYGADKNYCPNCGARMDEEDIPMEYFENGGR